MKDLKELGQYCVRKKKDCCCEEKDLFAVMVCPNENSLISPQKDQEYDA